MMDDKKLLQLIHHYGYDHQERKAVEEMSELTKELTKIWNCKNESEQIILIDNIQGEIADVYVMINQLMLLYGRDKIMSIAEHKVDRAIRRMNAHE